MPKTRKLLVVLLCAGLLIGCDKDKEEPKVPAEGEPAKPRDSGPEEVALAIVSAMETGDAEAVGELYDCSEEDRDCLERLAPIASKMSAFAYAGEKAYGRKAWAAAAEKVGMPNMADPVFPTVAEARGKIQCKVEGDKATCTVPILEKPLSMVRKDGKWYAVPTDLPEMKQREQVIHMMLAMVKGIDVVQGKIGKAGVTADQIFTEFAEAFKKAMAPPPSP